MKAQELVVEVKPKIVVDDDSAAMALKMIEWYVNATGKKLEEIHYADGTVSFYFKEVRNDNVC
jgi:hypothetical protein